MPDIVFYSVRTFCLNNDEVNTVLNGLSVRCSVPSAVVHLVYAPLVQLLSPSVKDVGMKLYDALCLYLENIVYAVAVWRECVWNEERRFGNGYGYRSLRVVYYRVVCSVVD